jgi:hypothetical protein
MRMISFTTSRCISHTPWQRNSTKYISQRECSVSKGVPVQNISVSRDPPVENIQSVRRFQYKRIETRQRSRVGCAVGGFTANLDERMHSWFSHTCHFGEPLCAGLTFHAAGACSPDMLTLIGGVDGGSGGAAAARERESGGEGA